MPINLDLTFINPDVNTASSTDVTYRAFPEGEVLTVDSGNPHTPSFAGSVFYKQDDVRRIYCIPFGATYVLMLDLNTMLTTQLPLPDSPTGPLYLGGVVTKERTIICPPYDADNFLLIKTSDNSLNTTSLPSPGAFGSKYWGGCLAPNGNAYFFPEAAAHVAIVNPVTLDIDTTSLPIPQTIRGTGSLAENGKIYIAPGSPASGSGPDNEIVVIDTNDNTSYTIGSVPTSGGISFRSSCTGKDGKIYCIPFDETFVLVIDPETDTFDTTTYTVPADFGKWIGGSTLPDGRIVFTPYNYDFVGILEIGNPTVDISTAYPTTTNAASFGSCIDDRGSVFFTPHSGADFIYEMRTGFPSIPIQWAYSAYMNKL